METHLPRISIITPSYNQGEFIGQTIESVLSQGYPDLELIVVDGGSTDGTLEILKSYGDRLAWTSEKDRGQSHAINKGMRRATGEIVAFLNSDDLYEPGALSAVGRFFAAHPQAAWLTGKCHTVDAQGREMRRGITLYKNFWLLLHSYRALFVLNYISQPATFWRKEVFDEVGDLSEGLMYTLEYDYWLRIGLKYRLWVLPRYLAQFRIHQTSKSGTTAHLQFEEQYKVAQSYRPGALPLRLHMLHNNLTVAVYRQTLSLRNTPPKTRPSTKLGSS